MRKIMTLLAIGLLVVIVMAPTGSPTLPEQGTEGPILRMIEPKGTEGPDIRVTGHLRG